jgi:hypothetical protein
MKQKADNRWPIADKNLFTYFNPTAIRHLPSAIFCASVILGAVASPIFSQGFLPPETSSPTVMTSSGPIQIGDQVPESLTVHDENGKRRAILTYKSAVEVMVIGFFSSRCPENLSRWHEMTHFYEDYKGWGVSFIAVNVGPPASRGELAKQMDKADLPFPMVEDEDHSLTTALKIESIPEFLILDEEGYLHYRGPMGKEARRAIEAVIGHMVVVPDPEPVQAAGCPVP